MKTLVRFDLKPYLESQVRAPFILETENETIEGTLILLEIKKADSDSIAALKLTAHNVVTVDRDSKKQIGPTKHELVMEYFGSPLLLENKTEASVTIRSHKELLTLFDPNAGHLAQTPKHHKAA